MTSIFDFYSGCISTAMDRTLQISVRITPTYVSVRMWERPVYQRHRNAEGGASSLSFKMAL